MKKIGFYHIIIRSILSTVLTVLIIASFILAVTSFFYSFNPTCEGLLGNEQWTCRSFYEYLFDAPSMIIWAMLVPLMSMCLFPVLWIIIAARQEYKLHHTTIVFREMRKKFFPLGFAYVVSMIIAYLIITLYFYLDGPFSPLVLIIWPPCYYVVYRFFLKKMAKK